MSERSSSPRPSEPSPDDTRSSDTSIAPAQRHRSRALRVVVATFGVLAALAGAEHGVGEIRQGPGPPGALVIDSWPDVAAFEIVSGEPAFTVVPDLVVSGLLTIVVAVALGVWTVWFVGRRHGAGVLIALSLLLLLVGGGFGPPLVGLALGFATLGLGRDHPPATGRGARALAGLWPWALGVGVVGYLSLVPGTVLLSWLTGFAAPGLVTLLAVVSFGALGVALVAAQTHDRLVHRE